MNYTKEDVESFLSCPLEHATIVKVERLSSDLLAWREIAEKLCGTTMRLMETHGMHGPCSRHNCSDCKRAYDNGRKVIGDFTSMNLAAYEKAVKS